jgi:DNA-binding transcriptional MerR regulator
VAASEKDPGAFRTIGELSGELGVAQHILRYWETKFPQLKPLQRAGNRRYYRPADVELARRIHHLLAHEGYTVRGVQKLLREKSGGEEPAVTVQAPEQTPPIGESPSQSAPIRDQRPAVDVDRLIDLRNRLAEALD